MKRCIFPGDSQFSPAFVLIILFLFFFSGCIPGKVPLPAADFASPEKVLERTFSKAYLKGTLKAIARTEIVTTRGIYPARIVVILQKPSFLRIENIPLIGSPNFFLSIMGNVLKVFIPPKGEFYIGKATTKNISYFLPVNLPVEDMLSLMTGVCPLSDIKDRILVGIMEDKLYRIDVLSQSNKKQSIWIDTTDNHIVRVDAFADQGDILYSAIFTDFARVGNAVLPRKLSIATGGGGNPAFILEYSELRLLGEADTEMFDLPLPPGIEPIMMD